MSTTTESIVFDRIERKYGNYYKLIFRFGYYRIIVKWNPTLEAQGRFTGNLRNPEGKQIDGFGGFSVSFPCFGGPYLNKKFEKFSDSEKEVITFLFPLKKDDDYFIDYDGNIFYDNLNGNFKKVEGKYFNRPSKEFVYLVKQNLPIINRELIAANILADRFVSVQEREKDVLFLRLVITYWSNLLASAFDSTNIGATVIPVSQVIEYKKDFKKVTGRDWYDDAKLTEEEIDAILTSQ